MRLDADRLYFGDVVHQRQRPRVHRLVYRVFSLLVDVDRLPAINGEFRRLSYNRANLFSIWDRDHGDGKTPIAEHARGLLRAAGFAEAGRQILLLCYPRMFGYGFNPLAVYFVLDPDGELETLIYQVHNTFGERRSYVVAAGAITNGVYAHGCAKELFVSPFTDGTGAYTFRVQPPGEGVLVAVLYKGLDGPVLRAHFRGTESEPLSDRALLKAAARLPLMTLKVTAGIHWEALKLWLKGVPLKRRHKSPKFAASYARSDPAAPRGRLSAIGANVAIEPLPPVSSPIVASPGTKASLNA